jgi:uncharacterized membrane protein YoaK (UPF0700 family)
MPSHERVLPRRFRDAAAVALAVTSGATDAIGFLALGGVFTSVLTGNMVLLGISVGRADGALAGHAAVAVVSYIAGCALGARIAGTATADDPIWPPAVTRALAIEATMFVLYAAGWWATGGRPDGGIAVGLLAVSAVALGMQSSVGGLSTTALTGTLTTLVIRLATGHRLRDVVHQLRLSAGFVGGAALAALLVREAPVLAPLMQPVALVVVLGIAGWRGHASKQAKPRRTEVNLRSGSGGSAQRR